MAENTQEPTSLKDTDTPVVGEVKGNHSLLLWAKFTAVGIVLAVLVVCGCVLYHHQKLSDDSKLAKSYAQFMASNTDCGQYLKQFGDSSGYRPATKADLLQSDANCAISTQQYSQAMSYLNKLQKLYTSNPKLYRYVDVAAAQKQVKQLKAQEPAKNVTSGSSTASTTGAEQSGGGYSGP